MNRLNKIILTFFFFVISANIYADKLGIVTGSKTGTYYQFGLNISETSKSEGIDLDVHNSSGSLENMYSVLNEPHAQLAIVQSDVLKFLSYSDNAQAKRMVEKTRLVYPLYNEEVHILAKNSVKDFYDLSGKKVAVGKKGSGTNLTATTLLKRLAEIDVEEVSAGGQEALGMLKRGEIDAMFYVAGYPVKLFKDSVTVADELKLLDITDKTITEFYVPSTIPSGAYPWLKDDVALVAVKAVVMTFDYKGSHCQNIYKIAKAVRENVTSLQANGHPKWKEVDLDLKLGGWDSYGCISDGKPKGKKVEWLDSITEGT